MASRRQLDFFGKLKLNETQRYGKEGKVAFENRVRVDKAAEKVRIKAENIAEKKRSEYKDPRQRSFLGKLEASIKKKNQAEKNKKTRGVRAERRKTRELNAQLRKEERDRKYRIADPWHTDGRASVLPANADAIKQKRLNEAKVPNAKTLYPPKYHLETGNFKTGAGHKKRTFFQAAELNSKTQAAQAKNILKRAKKIKRLSVKTVAVASVGSIIAAGINRKSTQPKIPKGYKMVFGRLVRVRQ